MRLGKRVKILIGLMTAWVTLYPFLFLAVWLGSFGTMIAASSMNSEPPAAIMLPFLLIFPLHFITIGLIILMMGFYIIHIIKNRDGNEIIRIIVALGLYMMPYFAMPIYYFIYIWPETPPEWAFQPGIKTPAQRDTPAR